MALAIVLYLSIAGMLTLVFIKRWEQKTGKLFASSVRPVVVHTSHSVAIWGKQLPSLAKKYVIRRAPIVRDTLHHSAAQVLLWVEHMLEQALHGIRRGTVAQGKSAPVSNFLREVAEHKQKLSAMHEEQNKTKK